MLCQELSPFYHWEMGMQKPPKGFWRSGQTGHCSQSGGRHLTGNRKQTLHSPVSRKGGWWALPLGGHMQNTVWLKNHQGQIKATWRLVQVPGLPGSTWPLHKDRLAENANSLEQANPYSPPTPCTRTKSWDSDFFFVSVEATQGKTKNKMSHLWLKGRCLLSLRSVNPGSGLGKLLWAAQKVNITLDLLESLLLYFLCNAS